MSHAAAADTLSSLVDKQRQVMGRELDKKLQDDGPGSKTAPPPPPAAAAPAPASVATEASAKKAPHSVADDLRVNAIYGVNGVTTVDVSIGDGPSYPITKDRSIKGWSIAKVSPSSVTFVNAKTRARKTIYLAEPTAAPAPAPAAQAPASSFGFSPSMPMQMGVPPLPRTSAQ
ncbi:hypothetical protein BZL54_23140 [Burkholderia ubonensis subsp. mesacidophila]|uniref:Type IV pilus biogenesis protein PilP n=1 Tax=Burkholderia ubonensis subsp. mesacidophila TaxID=265293 RepID=A0A2A4F890_9BURK|nr:hypothetical protein BZL54_23140 [Burkholderia ubonensis subsp. mesacidophila]